MVSPGSVNDGFAKIRVLSETTTPNEFNAAKVSLGVLGVISQVRSIQFSYIYLPKKIENHIWILLQKILLP